jgi:hypothetical protein
MSRTIHKNMALSGKRGNSKDTRKTGKPNRDEHRFVTGEIEVLACEASFSRTTVEDAGSIPRATVLHRPRSIRLSAETTENAS